MTDQAQDVFSSRNLADQIGDARNAIRSAEQAETLEDLKAAAASLGHLLVEILEAQNI